MRVELGEVEAALGLLPAVRDRVVIARSDAPGGEVNLVAYVVLDPAAGVTVSDLRHDLLGQLRPHMVPAQFVIMDSIPLNANGKVDRQALPEPDGSRPILAVSFVPPSTPTEERVAELCSALLGVSPIGIHDDLFEMGGQSLTATLLVSRLRDAFDIELPMNRIMEAPTVGQLAQLVDATLWAGSSVDQPVESTDGEPADQGVL